MIECYVTCYCLFIIILLLVVHCSTKTNMDTYENAKWHRLVSDLRANDYTCTCALVWMCQNIDSILVDTVNGLHTVRVTQINSLRFVFSWDFLYWISNSSHIFLARMVLFWAPLVVNDEKVEREREIKMDLNRLHTNQSLQLQSRARSNGW